MKHRFVQPTQPVARTSHLVLVTALHLSLLGFCVGSTTAVITSAPRATGEYVRYADLKFPTRAPAPARRAVKRHPTRTAPLHPASDDLDPPAIGPDLPAIQLDVNIETANVVDTMLAGLSRDSTIGPGLQAPSIDARSVSDEYSTGSYFAANVDTSAVAEPENPKPVYPEDMRVRSIEASFVAYFEVDTTGCVDRKTIEVSPSVRPQFANAVKDALVHWQYRPAQRHGHRVRQFVGQTFIFRIEYQGSWRSTPTT